MPVLLPDRTWVSDDGRWRFSGGRWAPVPPALEGRPGLLWFLGTAGWFTPALICGVIALVPIAGFMNLYGWSLATSENLRLGYRVPAPATFDWIRRGWRFGAWGCLAAAVIQAVALAAGLVAGAIAHAALGGWSWTVAIGGATWCTVELASALLLAPTTVPVLHLSDREGFGAALAPARVGSAIRARWHAAWYGTAALAAWGLAYVAVTSVAGAVPFVGVFASMAAAVPGYGVLGLMLAAPLARYDDPPETFHRGLTWLVAAGYAAFVVLASASAWTIALVGASVVSSHPDETRCFVETACDFSYSGDRETITRVARRGDLVIVEVDLRNHGDQPAPVDAGQFWIAAAGDRTSRITPTDDCPLPGSTEVPAHGRVTEGACFRFPAGRQIDVHVPWTGWDGKTG